MRLWRNALWLLCIGLICSPLLGETWYVRHDGGTRYSANVRKGQCDGKADAAYRGSGSNQHCAFKDYRYLYTDGTYGNAAWVIAGGDTVLLHGGPWRVGNSGPNANDYFGVIPGDPYHAYNPPIPAGTAMQHTRILGENYASCTVANKTQINGGYGVLAALNLSGAQFVDVGCIELTRHNQCTLVGVPASPPLCNKSYPLDDYAQNGAITDVHTHDVTLTDVWIHGFTTNGVLGPIGGTVTCLRCTIGYNGAAGWEFDDGAATPSVNAVWNFNYSTIEWNGCNQEYPITHAIPAISCYGQSDGGYGDGVGTPEHSGMTANVDHSIFRYNVQDGLDLLHIDTGNHSLSVTNSTFYGNNGAPLKWGPNLQTATVTNNIIMANCRRLAAPMTGAPASYNAHLGDFCRAGDAVPFDMRQGGTALIANNTIVSYAPTTFDVSCSDASCSDSTLTFKNNIVLGYANPAYDYGGGEGPGLFYYGQPIGKVVRSKNVYYGVKGARSQVILSSDRLEDPKFLSQPRFSKEQDLDGFDFHLSPSSPVRGMGASPQ